MTLKSFVMSFLRLACWKARGGGWQWFIQSWEPLPAALYTFTSFSSSHLEHLLVQHACEYQGLQRGWKGTYPLAIALSRNTGEKCKILILRFGFGDGQGKFICWSAVGWGKCFVAEEPRGVLAETQTGCCRQIVVTQPYGSIYTWRWIGEFVLLMLSREAYAKWKVIAPLKTLPKFT